LSLVYCITGSGGRGTQSGASAAERPHRYQHAVVPLLAADRILFEVYSSGCPETWVTTANLLPSVYFSYFRIQNIEVDTTVLS